MSRGQRKHPLYMVWCSMKQRCDNPNVYGYSYYGGRGIKYCERWRVFDNFLADMGPRPDGFTLDRIDSNGDYEPSNCRWASRIQQMNNVSSNVRVVVNGVEMTMAEAGRLNGIGTSTIWSRIRMFGWDPQRAATEPLRYNSKRHKKQAKGARNAG